jgi:hypothetical protein
MRRLLTVVLVACIVAGISTAGTAEDPHGTSRLASVSAVRLWQAQPRVAAPATFIPYDLDRDRFVVLDILDADGARVARLVEAERQGGHQIVRWRGTDDAGNPLPSGLYTARLSADGHVRSRPLALVR